MVSETSLFDAERRRILTEDRRRDAEMGDRHAAWQPGKSS
jgi:hypothetical protein